MREGQQAADGQLVDIPTSDRWVRDAQRVRIHVVLDEPLEELPPSGARATVQLVPGEHALAKPFAWLLNHWDTRSYFAHRLPSSRAFACLGQQTF